MDTISYIVFRFFIFLFRIIPFSVLFIFSDGICFLMYRVIGYRKAVIFQNLRNSFPGKSETEIRKMAGKFYHHLCDMLVESMKAFSMKEEEVVKRYQFEDTGFLDELYRQGRPAIVVAGHYGNWEWAGVASGTQMKHVPVGFYKPLSNKKVDAYVQRTRVQGRSKLVSITNTAAVFNTDYGEPAAFYMVADQSPSSVRLAYWLNFLGQDTAVLHGPEKYARIHNFPVVFAFSRKVSRGKYRVRFSMLVEDPSTTKMGEITEKYMRALEKVILEEPEYYLWSHKRWKLKR
ncbi:MAG: lysophospholipid acyltransferase family protein [Bacteroidetes bacterium]|nr:lysophospholipid acyltransferase family protein [Bacteroidota bacterium]